MQEQSNMANEQTRRFIRLKEVKQQISLGRTAIYEMIKAGEFPKPYPLGARAVGFLASEIDAWIDARIKAGGCAK